MGEKAVEFLPLSVYHLAGGEHSDQVPERGGHTNRDLLETSIVERDRLERLSEPSDTKWSELEFHFFEFFCLGEVDWDCHSPYDANVKSPLDTEPYYKS